ncbi:sensor histidine kinase [Paenibacillus marinisediminis]
MVISLCILIVILLIVIGLQYHSKRTVDKQLTEILNKLSDIVDHESAEKVLMPTDQKTIRLFLVQINRLLDRNQKVIADYARSKDSLRKMMSNMSHDLKTPLTVILGYVEQLKLGHGMSEVERSDVTFRLHQKTVSVITLLNQFFDLVKLESDDFILPLSKICINEVCRKNVLEYYALLQSKNLKVEINIPEENVFILGNEAALNRVFSNLISNAIRYGSDGGVFGLTIREDGDSIAIDIWDKGKGIDEIHQDRVFERLYTLDDARNPNFQGSGLGLSITKHLTEAMKGSIYLKSRPYEKTVFTCMFNRISY